MVKDMTTEQKVLYFTHLILLPHCAKSILINTFATSPQTRS